MVTSDNHNQIFIRKNGGHGVWVFQLGEHPESLDIGARPWLHVARLTKSTCLGCGGVHRPCVNSCRPRLVLGGHSFRESTEEAADTTFTNKLSLQPLSGPPYAVGRATTLWHPWLWQPCRTEVRPPWTKSQGLGAVYPKVYLHRHGCASCHVHV